MREDIERLFEEDVFSVWCSAGFSVLEKSGENIEETRPIGGWASTENLDRQEEVVVAKGLDFSEFVQWGYYNDNHKQDTAAVLGYPRLARLSGDRWYTEGNLLKGYPPSDKIWELAKALRGTPRSLGFSIEGKVVERNGHNRIVKAKVRNVAITNCPVNTDCTWGILAKAFASPAEIEEADAKAKALSAGYSTAAGGGAVLRRESLEGKGVIDIEEAVKRLKKIRPHYSKAVCERIVRFAQTKR